MTLDELLDLNLLKPEIVESMAPADLIKILTPHMSVTQPALPSAGSTDSIKTSDVLATAKKKVVTSSSIQETLRQLAEMKAKLTDENSKS